MTKNTKIMTKVVDAFGFSGREWNEMEIAEQYALVIDYYADDAEAMAMIAEMEMDAEQEIAYAEHMAIVAEKWGE